MACGCARLAQTETCNVLMPAVVCTCSQCRSDAGYSANLRSFAGSEEARSTKRRRGAAVADAAYPAERQTGASDAACPAAFACTTPPHASDSGGVDAAVLVGCKVEGTIESCTPDGGFMVELRTGLHVMRGARSAEVHHLMVRRSSYRDRQAPNEHRTFAAKV